MPPFAAVFVTLHKKIEYYFMKRNRIIFRFIGSGKALFLTVGRHGFIK